MAEPESGQELGLGQPAPRRPQQRAHGTDEVGSVALVVALVPGEDESVQVVDYDRAEVVVDDLSEREVVAVLAQLVERRRARWQRVGELRRPRRCGRAGAVRLSCSTTGEPATPCSRWSAVKRSGRCGATARVAATHGAVASVSACQAGPTRSPARPSEGPGSHVAAGAASRSSSWSRPSITSRTRPRGRRAGSQRANRRGAPAGRGRRRQVASRERRGALQLAQRGGRAGPPRGLAAMSQRRDGRSSACWPEGRSERDRLGKRPRRRDAGRPGELRHRRGGPSAPPSARSRAASKRRGRVCRTGSRRARGVRARWSSRAAPGGWGLAAGETGVEQGEQVRRAHSSPIARGVGVALADGEAAGADRGPGASRGVCRPSAGVDVIGTLVRGEQSQPRAGSRR